MTGVVSPSAKGFLVWSHAKNASGDPVKILATDAGILYVTFDGIPASGEKLFAIKDTTEETADDTNLPGGAFSINGTTVPANELWHITHIAYQYIGTVPTYIQIMAIVNSNGVLVAENRAITTVHWYTLKVDIWLNAGDNVRMSMYNTTATDTARFRYCGTKQAI